jgi:hypothetical protein
MQKLRVLPSPKFSSVLELLLVSPPALILTFRTRAAVCAERIGWSVASEQGLIALQIRQVTKNMNRLHRRWQRASLWPAAAASCKKKRNRSHRLVLRAASMSFEESRPQAFACRPDQRSQLPTRPRWSCRAVALCSRIRRSASFTPAILTWTEGPGRTGFALMPPLVFMSGNTDSRLRTLLARELPQLSIYLYLSI